MVRTKVFVGNLSFKIRENELAEQFSAAGKVVGANIITRQNRSLGYGFVEMESLEEAQKAVELFNKKEIDGRAVNVEVARVREEGEQGPAGEGARAAGSSPAAPRAEGERRPRTRRPRAPRGPRAPGAPGSPAQQGGEGSSPAAQQGGDGQRAPRRRAPRRRGPSGPRTGGPAPAGGSSAGPSSPAAGGERAPRQPRAPRAPRADQPPRAPSANTLFVANLPFSVDDQGLTDLFKDFNVKSAHVVMKRNARSKGFGFVEFNNEEDQKAALAKLDNSEVQGRNLIVKVALTEGQSSQASEPAAEQK